MHVNFFVLISIKTKGATSPCPFDHGRYTMIKQMSHLTTSPVHLSCYVETRLYRDPFISRPVYIETRLYRDPFISRPVYIETRLYRDPFISRLCFSGGQ